jgi:hypothetical protein
MRQAAIFVLLLVLVLDKGRVGARVRVGAGESLQQFELFSD